MATNRSRRLRKKLCVDEFQELGFELNLNFKEDLADAAIVGGAIGLVLLSLTSGKKDSVAGN